MFDNDFEKTKTFFNEKLEDYLLKKGIDTLRNFPCLNPEHVDSGNTMSFDNQNHVVHCFVCNKSYNIFDLISLDYKLENFLDQLNKLKEIYKISPPIQQTPNTIMINNTTPFMGSPEDGEPVMFGVNPNDTNNFNNVHTIQKEQRKFHSPTLDIDGYNPFLPPNTISNTTRTDSTITRSNIIPQKNNIQNNIYNKALTTENFKTNNSFDTILVNPTQSYKKETIINTPHIPSPSHINLKDASNIVAGPAIFGNFRAANDSVNNDTAFESYSNEVENTNFIANEEVFETSNTINNINQNIVEQDELSLDEYFKICHENVKNTDYFYKRGLNDEIIEKFNLGFDNSFIANKNVRGHDNIVWNAVIIPHNQNAFMARNTDINAQDRIRKEGNQDIFNLDALDKDGNIFITEGEFDALSLESLGYNALALGGAHNYKFLIEHIKNKNIEKNKVFYIATDNDDLGVMSCKELSAALYQLKINFKIIDISYPYKDINESLCKDKKALIYKLENIDKILSFSFTKVTNENVFTNLITDNESLSKLNLNNKLYTFTGDALSLRNCVASIIEDGLSSIVYASSKQRFNLLCALFKQHNMQEQNLRYQSLNNAKLLEIPSYDDIEDTINLAICATKVQKNSSFVLIVDALGFSCEKLSKILENLSYTAQTSNLPIIALVSKSCAEIANAISIQNIEINLSNQNCELEINSNYLNGQLINFKRYIGV